MNRFALFLLSWAAAASLSAAEFFVSPAGSDSAAGTAAAPFASLTRARDAIRTLKGGAGLPPEGITVWLRGGNYNLTATFTLESQDSGTASAPIVYAAYPGEEARITGARPLDPSWFSVVDASSPVWDRIDAAARGHVLVADLPAHGLSNFGTLKDRGYGALRIAPLTLFCDGRPMTLARWPNDPREFALTDSVPSPTQITYSGDRPARWTQAEEPWLHGLWTQYWADFHLKIAAIDTANRTLTLAAAPASYGITAEHPFYAYNLLEEIDQPGEYYLDRSTGRLYFWPAAPLAGATLQVSMLEVPLVQIAGAQHLTFRGLVFEASRAGLIAITSGTHNRLERCLLRNAQNAATVAGTANGLHDCEIVDCDEDGVRLAGGNRATLVPGGNYVTNCRIHRISRTVWTYHPAVNLRGGCGNIVAHNLLDDLPHSAVLFSGNDHRIEGNEIRRVCRLTSDCGAIYTGRDWGYRGNLITGNFLHHIETLWGSGARGVYLDDMVAGPAVTGNVFYALQETAIFCGAGRDLDLSNNVIAACNTGHYSGDYARTWVTNTPGDSWNLLERLAAEGIQYQQEPWASRYPACAAIPNNYATILTGLWRNPQGCRFVRNAGWANSTWMREYDKSGTGVFSVYASITDNTAEQIPLFDDRASLDRSLRPVSLAANVSAFTPIAFAEIGRDFSAWPAATRPPAAPALTVRAASPTQVELEWIDYSNLAGNQETGFTLERRNLPDGPWQTLRTYGPDSDFDSETGLAPATRYAYRIRAANAVGTACSPEAALTTPTLLVPVTTPTRLEAETAYTVVADVGSYGTVGISNGTLDSERSLRLYDVGDSFSRSFTLTTGGLHRLGFRGRAGGTGFWPNGYSFRLDGNPLSMVGDTASLSAYDTAYGGSYWGTMTSDPLQLAAGVHTITVTAANSWAVADYLEVALVAPPAQTTFAAWAAVHFSTDQLASPALSSPLAPPAGDGTPNLLKYALGLDPWTANHTPLGTATLAAGRLQFDYSRPLGRTGVTYVVEASADLQTWTPLTAAVVASDGITESIRALDTAAAGDAPRRFLRLRVTQLP
ncbi:MAG: hypothetical protein IPL39_22655 [Opitutaceae bacterium]|nr:hypothetical protein [Opitutaceae bacterium]